MKRSNWKRLLLSGVAVLLLVLVSSPAEACRGCGWGGYYGGYGGWGGYGGYGGYSGGYGGYSGGWSSYYGGWGGYSGGWSRWYGGGWGGYSTPYYSSYYSGYSSCCGCYSSCGDACSGAYSSSQPAAPATSAPRSSGVPRDGGSLLVSVPSDAKVIINGLETRTTGSRRQYYSSGLQPGFNYNYVIRAQVVRNGQTQEDTRTVTLTAGKSAVVDIGFHTTPQQVARNP